jgi:NAD(P)-dependent dehydrogenase (short-subunit alcohol dehydrogenase family)
MANKPTVLIIGASRGLGLALAEQFCSRDWHVIATVRGNSSGLDALKARLPANLEEETADIADEVSVHALRRRLDDRTLDMLFVDAGIAKSITKTHGAAGEYLQPRPADRDFRGHRRAERHNRRHVLRTREHHQQ